MNQYTLMIPAEAFAFFFYHFVEIPFAIVVIQFFAGLDCSDRMDEYSFSVLNGFTIWFARMVDVPGKVLAHTAVDREIRLIEIKQIVPAFLLRFFIRDDGSVVFDHEILSLDRRFGK